MREKKMKTPETSKHFKRVVDPVTGVPHYVLTTKLAKHQQSLYFVNNPMSRDGRYLWFWSVINPIYPDGEGKLLSFIDFETDEITICYDIPLQNAPYVDPDDGTVYFITGSALCKREPKKDKFAEVVCRIPVFTNGGGYATHLTRTRDKNKFFLDMKIKCGGGVLGLLDIRDGSFTEWCRTERPYNHGQLNPQNDDLALAAYDAFTNPDGTKNRIPYDENGIYQRLWTLTSDGKRKMWPAKNNYATHEWWSADGKTIYYCCDYYGIYGIDYETGKDITILEGVDPWHAYSTKDDSLFIWDEKKLERYGGKWYRGCPSALNFFNRTTGKNLVVISEMPENGHTPENQNPYHIDPHPRFTENEKYAIFTTTELGGVDLGVVVVDELLELTK